MRRLTRSDRSLSSSSIGVEEWAFAPLSRPPARKLVDEAIPGRIGSIRGLETGINLLSSSKPPDIRSLLSEFPSFALHWPRGDGPDFGQMTRAAQGQAALQFAVLKTMRYSLRRALSLDSVDGGTHNPKVGGSNPLPTIERHCRNAVAFPCLQRLRFPESRPQTSRKPVSGKSSVLRNSRQSPYQFFGGFKLGLSRCAC